MAKSFEELEIWKLSIELDKNVYKCIQDSKIKTDFALRDQMLRSCGSIADNIAEGFERGGNKEFIQFLFIAKGSCGELRSQFQRSLNRQLITEKEFDSYYNTCKSLSVKISNLISHLKSSEYKGNKYT